MLSTEYTDNEAKKGAVYQLVDPERLVVLAEMVKFNNSFSLSYRAVTITATVVIK